MRLLAAAFSGLVFAIGLGLAGMADPAKVLGFMDVAGDWDPSLAFVMAGAMGTYAIARRIVLRRSAPLCADAFPNPPRTRPDGRLLLGSAIFGVGWGLAGWCPGAGFVALAGGAAPLLAFMGGMFGGMALFRLWEARRAPHSGRFA